MEKGDSSSEGKTLVDSYRARVFTLCALYVAQGIPWGFITVTFVTFLAARGVGAGELAGLLTLGTLPWSVKFLWGPIIDLYQMADYGRRRPWILLDKREWFSCSLQCYLFPIQPVMCILLP